MTQTGGHAEFVKKKKKELAVIQNHGQQSEINKIISKYKTLFAKDKYDIGTVKGYDAHIDLQVDKYCSKRPYRKTYEIKIGKLVYVENGNSLNRKKLEELKIGPYQVLEKLSNSIYRINTGHKKFESNLFHVTKLVPVPDESKSSFEGEM
ncbi:hypothetical protein HELRODRAFT_174235 [Helobdella robusta]|uniref:Integrase p58-like C-terminal domain-containing protein n=1 Tax=Helobdella robusta TaxID=6412 RepID=T1F7U6_HELRO|nr:hypothetical protein HELRODRAFT_174235 [Helobdella robusta]ESO02812.1 hypothetical protein HELRODRAFT_174235 [Helobdella robusta]